MAKNKNDAGSETKSRKPLIVAAIVLAVVLAVGGYVMTRPAPEPVEDEEAATEVVQKVALGEEAMTFNLADGRVLKVTVVMGLTAELDEYSMTPESFAPGRDIVIEVLGANTSAELSTPEGRGAAKTALLDALSEHYDVHAVYFSDFIIP